MKLTIGIENLDKVDLRVGKVVEAGIPKASEKLIKLVVNFGDDGTRIIFTGMKTWYNPEYFQGKQFIFVYNLEPKKMINEESQGMVMAVDTPDGPKPIEAPEGSKAGQKIK